MASYLDHGSISYLYYADRLNQLPLGIVGIAVGTALLPMLSRAMMKDDPKEAQTLFSRALEYCLLLALPAAVALAVIPHTIITVLFERGAFTAADSMITANVLSGYALGLPAYIVVKVFSTAHWAREDTKTPVRISVIATILNIVLSLIFIQFFGVIGIAYGTGITAWLQVVLHMRALKNHPSAHFDHKFKLNFPKIIGSACVMGGGVYILSTLLEDIIFGDGQALKIMALMMVILAGSLLYFACIIGSGAIRLSDIKRYLVKRP